MRTFLALAGSVAILALISLYAVHYSESDAAVGQRIESDIADLQLRSGSLEETVRELSNRIAALTNSVDALRISSARDRVNSTVAESSMEGVSTLVDELTKQVEQAVLKVEEMESRARPVMFIGRPEAPESEEERARVVNENQAIAMDRSLANDDRLAALRNLRSRGGRSHEVTLSMIELIQDPDVDGRTRADIIRNLHRVDFEELKQPLLTVLENDGNNEVRSETVETLDVFYDDPAVFQAVAHVRDNDPDPQVRMEAMHRLLQHQQRAAAVPSER